MTLVRSFCVSTSFCTQVLVGGAQNMMFRIKKDYIFAKERKTYLQLQYEPVMRRVYPLRTLSQIRKRELFFEYLRNKQKPVNQLSSFFSCFCL